MVSHGLSYRLNYIGRGEYLRTSAASQMFAPYGRLVVLHITIIVGALAIGLTGAPAAAIVVLIVLKTVLDLGLHFAERRRAVASPVSRGPCHVAPGRGARRGPITLVFQSSSTACVWAAR